MQGREGRGGLLCVNPRGTSVHGGRMEEGGRKTLQQRAAP
jgi:hypothetical protein